VRVHVRVPAILGVTALLLVAPAASAQDTLVTTGNPYAAFPFSQNKQNEPAVAVDPSNPAYKAAGTNEEIDMEGCNAGPDTDCPFTEGVGVSGVYFSQNGGAWLQPAYSGWTARHCLGTPGPDPGCMPRVGTIGTLPRYYENGLVSDGDPALVYGPRPSGGRFRWANGSRLYYANLASNFSSARGETAFPGAEAIYASYTDNTRGVPSQADWSDPVLVSRQNSALFSDKEQIWADNVERSPYFGNVYICNVGFRSRGQGGAPEPVLFARSTDGGVTWSQRQITSATNNGQTGGRQGCSVRSDSRGNVYLYWVGTDIHTRGTVFFQARSFDGGRSFEKERVVARVVDVGRFDPASGRFSFDGVAGARTWTIPVVDIANGAPTGDGATDEIVLAGPTGPTPSDTQPGPNERVIVRYSTDRGETFTDGPVASAPADRPDFPAIAISPTGERVWVVYDAFHAPWQSTTASPRMFEGVVRTATVAAGGAPTGWTDRHRGTPGDARSSSANGLTSEFLGDYNYAFAFRGGVTLVWNDARNGDDCPAIDAYRQAYVNAVNAGTAEPADEENPNDYDAPTTAPPAPAPPAVQTACGQPPNRFGNSDVFGATFGP
jgi:hypothetical protein